MCFNINLKPPPGVLESSSKPVKLIHFFNRPISMKVNWACLLSSRLHIHTVALIHNLGLLKAQCSSVSHWAPSGEQLKFKSLGQVYSCKSAEIQLSHHKLSLTTI